MFDDINYWRSKAQNLENHIQEVSEAIRLDGGQKIRSVANRMLFFDATKLHNSTTCTDEKGRFNINFNYF